MKQSFMKLGAVFFLSLFGSVTLLAQLVKNDRMFSFEESQVPACISSESSKLSISPEHYKDGTHSLLWTFQPNATLSLKKSILVGPSETVTRGKIEESDSQDKFFTPKGIWPTDHKGNLATFKVVTGK